LAAVVAAATLINPASMVACSVKDGCGETSCTPVDCDLPLFKSRDRIVFASRDVALPVRIGSAGWDVAPTGLD